MSVAKKVGYRCRGERQFCMMVTRTGLAAPPVIEIAALFIPALLGSGELGLKFSTVRTTGTLVV
jgi:hypothetical protein